MKHWLVTSVILVVAAIGCYLAVTSLLSAIDNGKLKRSLGDSRSLATAIESYRIDHSVYPRGFTASTLNTLEPRYIRSAPLRGVSYFSDGINYAFVLRPYSEGGPSAMAPIVVNNGRIVSWPSEFDDQAIDQCSRDILEFRQRANERLVISE